VGADIKRVESRIEENKGQPYLSLCKKGNHNFTYHLFFDLAHRGLEYNTSPKRRALLVD
jgi:hypothetical protein